MRKKKRKRKKKKRKKKIRDHRSLKRHNTTFFGKEPLILLFKFLVLVVLKGPFFGFLGVFK